MITENGIMSLCTEDIREMFLYVSDVIIENEAYLTEIDNLIGDGDHGIGMRTGFKGVKEALSTSRFQYVNEVFRSIGLTLLKTMGGASGVLFGTIFVSGIVGMSDCEYVSLADFASIFKQSVYALKQRGKAVIGDKTMIDALEPAANELAGRAAKGDDFESGLFYAKEAARRGMLFTKECRARFGRAKYYGDKAIGLLDAGAVSVFLIFDAMYKWIKKIFRK